MDDLKSLKQRIYEEDRVGELLVKLGCERINPVSNRVEAQLPPKFNSDNTRSVQVYKFEGLPCRIRSRSTPVKLDIFGLVSYIKFDIYDEEGIRKNIPIAKRWICDELNYETMQSTGNYSCVWEDEDPLDWLKKLRKSRPKKLKEMDDNKVFPDSLLSQYVMYPYYDYFLKENIPHHIQKEYEIGFDLQTERVIFPIRNKFGEIISVKGRTIDSEYKKKGIPKFLYLYPYNKQIEWYNWNFALYDIIEKNEVIIFEAEKSCWKAASFDCRNTLAIGGSDISKYQVEFFKQLPLDIKIILAFDKDKSEEDILNEASKFGRTRFVYTIWDSKNLLSKKEKHSPVDVNKEVFETLYRDSLNRRIR